MEVIKLITNSVRFTEGGEDPPRPITLSAIVKGRSFKAFAHRHGFTKGQLDSIRKGGCDVKVEITGVPTYTIVKNR